MFTGIIQSIGEVRAFTRNSFGAKLTIAPQHPLPAIASGDSVNVNGVCLTYTPNTPNTFGTSNFQHARNNPGQSRNDLAHEAGTPMLSFDVIAETLQASSLGSLSTGDQVNLETSLTPSTPMGGHFVQGHVDALGTIRNVINTPEQWRTTIHVDPHQMPFFVPKGSVAVDGVSLTIASIDSANTTFDVALIPTTLNLTTLAQRKVGDRVNIETDIIARTVVHWLATQQGNPDDILRKKLSDAGFLD